VKNSTGRASVRVGEWAREASEKAAAAGSMAKDMSSFFKGKAKEMTPSVNAAKELGKGAVSAAGRLVGEVKNTYKAGFNAQPVG